VNLTEQIKEMALHNGVTYFGVADLSNAKEAILNQGGSEIAGFSHCISLGISLINHIVDQLPRRSEQSVAMNYRHHAYDIINQRLDLAASVISGFIQQQGYAVFPVPASKHTDNERICAIFSHKMGASLAGLGWIGKSCLLITPGSGPRVRWVSVLTDASIEPTGQLMEERCGDCTACVDVCPMKAFTGRPFYKEEPREVRYDARRCEKYFKSMKAKGQIEVCGMCLYICPYGRKQGTTI